MLRTIGTACLVATFLLALVVGSCVAGSWGSLGWSDNWKAQVAVPLPSGYETWHWLGGCDFGHVRGSSMWWMKAFRLVGDCSLAGLVSYMVGLTLGGVWALEGTQQAALARTSLAGALLGGPLFGSGLSLGGKSPSEWIAVMHTGCPSVEALEKEIGDLRFKAGISDYYTFGTAVAPRYTPVIAGGPLPHEIITVPLGARMKIRLGSSSDYYNMGYPPGEFRIIYDAWPRVIRLTTPTLDFGKLDARVWEMDIAAGPRSTSVQYVFPYEMIGGKAFLLPTKDESPGLSVTPDSPEKGGKILGKVDLRYDPRLGEVGLREIHVSSPVNQGILSKKIDHHVFAIVINKRTVTVTPSKKELRVGEELVVDMRVRGFHPTAGNLPVSGGKAYPRDYWAGAILRGASLQGAGITETQITHGPLSTLLKATVNEPGKAKAVLQTEDGPVQWELATVEKASDRVRLGALKKDDCPPAPEANLRLSKCEAWLTQDVKADNLECEYEQLYDGQGQTSVISLYFGHTRTLLSVLESVEEARRLFPEQERALRQRVTEEEGYATKQGSALKIAWDDADPDALLVELIWGEKSKFYGRFGVFRYKNSLFAIGTHLDGDRAWVIRVFDKLKEGLKALVDSKAYEERPPA